MKKILRYYNSTGSILILALLGAIFGYYFPQTAIMFQPLGLFFVNLIKMLVIPIIFVSILHAVVSIEFDGKKMAAMGSFIVCYFIIASFVGGLLGSTSAAIFQPGAGDINLPKELLTLDPSLEKQMVQNSTQGFWDFIFSVIPNNPLTALAEGKLLSIVFFTVFLGIAILNIKNSYKVYVVQSLTVFNDALIWMISRIMFLAPIAVFSLIAYFMGAMGFDIIYLVGKLMLNISLAVIFWVYVVLGIVVVLLTRVGYFQFLKKTLPVKLIALGSSSSLVSLPVNKKACKELGVSDNISSLILPLGSSIHMNGSAIYYSVVAVFFAQLFGVPLAPIDYIMMALIASIASIATPGVPGLSLSIIMVLAVANVPLIGLPLIFAIDRILDMLITACNVIGNTVCALVTERFFGSKLKQEK